MNEIPDADEIAEEALESEIQELEKKIELIRLRIHTLIATSHSNIKIPVLDTGKGNAVEAQGFAQILIEMKTSLTQQETLNAINSATLQAFMDILPSEFLVNFPEKLEKNLKLTADALEQQAEDREEAAKKPGILTPESKKLIKL